MDIFETALAGMDGGSVLDIATHEGGFIDILCEYLQRYTRITGIDIDPGAIPRAHNRLSAENIHFCWMDAKNLGFDCSTFDMVSCSASLHHLDNIPAVLSEMVRVLRPGGEFLLVEMHSSSQQAPEQTYIFLHNWVADVDTALGLCHNPLLPDQAIRDLVAALGLSDQEVLEQHDQGSDPMERQRLARLENLIDRTIKRLEGLAENRELLARGESLRQRLHTVGAYREPLLLVKARKG